MNSRDSQNFLVLLPREGETEQLSIRELVLNFDGQIVSPQDLPRDQSELHIYLCGDLNLWPVDVPFPTFPQVIYQYLYSANDPRWYSCQFELIGVDQLPRVRSDFRLAILTDLEPDDVLAIAALLVFLTKDYNVILTLVCGEGSRFKGENSPSLLNSIKN